VTCFVCQKIYSQGRETTCSDTCHEELVRRLIAEFGEFKKVVRQKTGVAYRVPTTDIIELGVKEVDLDQYPRWEEKDGDKTYPREPAAKHGGFEALSPEHQGL